MSRLDHYAEWLIANQNLKGTPNFEAVASAYRDLRATPEESEEMPAPQMQPQPEETPEPQGRLGAAAKRGVHALSEQAAGIGLGLESAFGKQEAAQKQMEAIKADQAKSAQGVKSTQFKDIEDIYGKEGLIAAAKEVPGYIAEKALESAPSAAAPLGVGLAAASVTGPVGGAIAGATTAVVQMFGEMMQRQAQEKQNAGELEPGKAAGAAVPAGLLDYAVDRVTLGMANPFKQAVKEAAEQEIKKSVLGAVAKRAAISAPLGAATEIGQQALELTQAGLPIYDEAAKQEYKEAGIAGGLLEGLAGGAGAAYRTRAQNQEAPSTEETRSPQPEVATEEPINQPEPIAQDETETTTEVPSYDRGTIETGNVPEVEPSETPAAVPNKEEITAAEQAPPIEEVASAEDVIPEPEQKVLAEQPDAIKDFVGRETQHTALKTKPSVIKDTIEAFKNFDADRAAQMLVRPAAPVSTELKERGIFEDDKLRGDSIIHANKQIGNVIQAASESGPAVPAGDGTLKASVNPRLAPINIFRNVVDTGKKYGFDGAQQLAEAYRISWGEETLAEDAKMKAKAQELKTQAKDYEDIANDMAKKGNAKVNEITAAKAKAQALKNKADALEDIYRERTVTPEDIKKKDAFLKAAPEMKQHIQDLRDLIRANVDLWYETGRIDKETRDQWNSKKYYMPMQVFSEAKGTFDDVPESWGVGAGARSVAGMEKRKGHSQAVNLWDNLQKQQAFMTAIAGQNLARNEALTQLEKYGSAKKAADQSDSNKKGNYVVSYVDGKKTWWEVKNPALVDAFQNFNYQLSPLMKIAQKGAQVLRTTALVQPYYWYKQLVIDPIHASFVGGVGNLTPLHSFTEFAKILTNTSKAVPVLRRHGVIGPVDVIHDADAVKDQIGYAMQAKPISVSKLAHALTKIHEAADASTRAAAYNKALTMAKQQGLTGDAAENFAVNKARELINFSVHGISSSVNTMRNMVPFFSAALNSLDTTYRAATGHNLNAKEAAKARADFRNAAALTFTLTSIYTLMMLQDQDYLDAKGIDKDGNWLVPLPDDENGRHGFLKIPAPHEIGFLFKTLPELLIRGMMNDATTKEILTSIGEGISRNTPPLMPMAQIVKPTVDVTRNYNALTGAPIESTGQQRLPVERRGEASASEISKFASDDLKAKNINLSPAKIDYLIRGYFAEWGALGSALADSMIRTYKGEDKTPTKDWLNSKENPMRSMFTNPISSRSKAQLYELFESSQQIVNSVTDYQKQGNVEKIKELMADPETKKQYATAAGMKAFIDKEAEFNRQIKIISNRPDTPANRALIKSLQRKSNDNASKAIAVAKKLGLPY